MKISLLSLLLYCALLLNPVVSMAASPLPTLLLQGLNHLNQLRGFSAHFTQTITYQNGNNNLYSGTITVKRPSKFRWHYERPYVQSYISDGSAIWHYEPDLMQAVRMQDLGTVDPIAMQLLDGRVRPQDVQLVSNNAINHGSMRNFAVRVRNTIALTLTLDQHGTLVGITHIDLLGNSNHIALSAIDTTIPDEAQFHFTPPQGVDIIIEGEQ